MVNINWGRVILSGLLCGLIWTLLSIVLMAYVGADFLEAVSRRGADRSSATPHAFLLISNFAAGIWSIALYAAIRPRFGAGPKTAVIAGCAWWFIQTLQSAKWVALVGIAGRSAVALCVMTLPAMILAVLAGAWRYQERTDA